MLGGEVVDRHYDADGTLTGFTVRGSEWSDVEREKMLALAEYEAHICDCGLPESVADEDPLVKGEVRICPICAGHARDARVQQAVDDEAVKRLGKNPPPEAPRPDDGRHMWNRVVPPDEAGQR